MKKNYFIWTLKDLEDYLNNINEDFDYIIPKQFFWDGDLPPLDIFDKILFFIKWYDGKTKND